MDSTVLTTIIVAIFGSTGFWALITNLIMTRSHRKTAEAEMLMGLGHDRIVYLGEKYIKRGYITKDEYENLHDYLYEPYKKLNGNGTAKKIMGEVEKLPIKDNRRTDK